MGSKTAPKVGIEPMIVCHCKGITDRQIRKAVRDGAQCRNDVVMACTAGKTCGGCVPVIDEIIESEGASQFGSNLLSMPSVAAG